MRFLAWNMPYHVEHHVYPQVPFHRLPELHRMMRDALKVTADGYAGFTRDYLRRRLLAFSTRKPDGSRPTGRRGAHAPFPSPADPSRPSGERDHTMTETALPKNEDSRRGFGFALTAYLMWGFLPLYMKAMAHISPAEVIAHRVIWSIPIAGAVLVALGRTSDIRAALRNPRTLGMAAATAALISVNWGIYVWSIVSGHALDAALGYYINPLFCVFLGAVLLGERLSGSQKVAIALAAVCGGDPDHRGRKGADRGTRPDVDLGVLCLSEEVAADRPEPGLLPGGPDAVRAGARLCAVATGARRKSFPGWRCRGYLAACWDAGW